MLTDARARELFIYNMCSGKLINKVKRHGRSKAGEEVGSLGSKGHLNASVDGHPYKVHNIIWLMMTGSFPPEGKTVDHKDRNPSNNAFGNLRLADPDEQAANRSIRADNKTGVKGVHRRGDKFIVTIARKYRGIFGTLEEATLVARAAGQVEYGEFAA
jgi:HNH endonuclease